MPVIDFDTEYRLALLLTRTPRAAAEAIRVAFRTKRSVLEAALRPGLWERLRRRMEEKGHVADDDLAGRVLSLPLEDRAAIVLKYHQEWTDEQLAAQFPAGQVSSAMTRLVTQSGGLSQLKQTDVATTLADQIGPALAAFAAAVQRPDALRQDHLVRENRRRRLARAGVAGTVLAVVAVVSLVPSFRLAAQERAMRLYYGWLHPFQVKEPRIPLPSPEPIIVEDVREAQRKMSADPETVSNTYGLFYPWELPPTFRVIRSSANFAASAENGVITIDPQVVYMRLDFRGGPRDEWINTMQTLRRRGVAEQPDSLPKGTRMVNIRGYNVYMRPPDPEGMIYFSAALDYGNGWYHWLWGSSPMYEEEIVQLLDSLLK